MTASVSVAVCTKDRAKELQRCLLSLSKLNPPPAEILVVDNNSRTGETRSITEKFGLKYFKETVAGLCAARNCAIQNSTGEMIAFIDDDCEADRNWIDEILKGFDDPEVGCVTGKAISPDQKNRWQREFEQHSRRFYSNSPFQLTLQDLKRVYSVRAFGVGANMAFRRNLLLKLSCFPHKPWDNGDDDYIFYKVTQAGYKIQFVPGSIVYQHHRETFSALIRRFYDYGLGAMRILSYLSGEKKTPSFFFENALFVIFLNLKGMAASIWKGLPARALFDAAQLAGNTTGILLLSLPSLRDIGSDAKRT